MKNNAIDSRSAIATTIEKYCDQHPEVVVFAVVLGPAVKAAFPYIVKGAKYAWDSLLGFLRYKVEVENGLIPSSVDDADETSCHDESIAA